MTSAIRLKEKDIGYISEEDIVVSKTAVALSELQKLYNERLDNRLNTLTLGDISLTVAGGYSKKTRVLDVINCSDDNRQKEVIPTFQVIYPFFKNAVKIEGIDMVFVTVIETMHSLGYNFVNKRVFSVKMQPFGTKNPIKIALVQFEAAYADVVDQLSDKLFHVTTVENAVDIMQKGLIPKESLTGEFKYGPRVYLFSNAILANIFRFIEHRFMPLNNKNICMVKVDKNKLVSSLEFKTGKMLFYVDPMFSKEFGKTAVFTDSRIPVKFIDDIVIMFRRIGKRFVKCGTVKMSDAKT